MTVAYRTFWLSLLVLSAACADKMGQEALPEIARLPSVALQNQDGDTVQLDQLRGQIRVANFIFTSCPTICPVLTRKMRALQERLPAAGYDEVAFLSFSVDPTVDTPERLREFGARYGADFSNWHFLTGDAAVLERTVKDGFKLALGDRAPRDDGSYDILHSGHFVLIDAAGVIRGYYPSAQEGLDLLAQDIARLKAESPR